MSKKQQKRKGTSAKLVVKDNKLINARYNLSVAEMRLFLSMITQIRREDQAFKTYRIYINDFVDTLGTSAKNVYARARETSKQLMEKVLEIENEKGPLQIHFVSSAQYHRGKGYVDLRFDPHLKPYLLQLKEKFTAYDIRNVLQLQSAHSIRIYELLKQYETIGERTFSLQRLKEILGVADQYSRYNDFKRFVLFQAQKELEKHCDITFEFEERKKGRRIEEIHFIIKRKTTSPLPYASIASKNGTGLEQDLAKMGLTAGQVRQVIAEKTEEAIQAAIAYTQKRYQSTKGTADEIRNVPGYLLRVLESEAGVPAFVVEEGEKEKEQLVQKAKAEEEKEAQMRANELIEQLQDAFRTYRKTVYIKQAKQASPEDWQAFEAYAREHIFLKKKFVSNGKLKKEEEEIDYWLGSFLTDRDWPDTPENFIRWVYEQEGYQLEMEKRGGELGYKITGRQERLF